MDKLSNIIKSKTAVFPSGLDAANDFFATLSLKR